MTAGVRDAGRYPDTAAPDATPRRPAGRRTRAPLLAAVVQRAVQLLQRAHTDVAADPGCDALDRRRGTLNRRHTGNVHSDRRRPDLVAIDAWARISIRGVDHHVDVTGADRVDRGRRGPPRLRRLEMLTNLIARNPVAAQHLRGT